MLLKHAMTGHNGCRNKDPQGFEGVKSTNLRWQYAG